MKLFTSILMVLWAGLLCSCGLSDDEDNQYFDYSLHGIWETTEEADSLYAKMEISYGDITITGVKNIAHFKNFTPSIGLEGYSIIENGDSLLYIHDYDGWKEPVSYAIREIGTQRNKILVLKGSDGGLKDETFKLRKEQ